MNAHDDDHVRGDRETPGNILGSDKDLYSPRLEKPFDDLLVLLVQSFMVVANTMLQSLHETLVSDMVQMRLEVLLFDVEESIAVVIGTTVCKDVIRSETTLATRRNEYDDGLGGGVLNHCDVCRF